MSEFESNLRTWASTGEEYPADYQYRDGETPVDKWDNYAMYHIIEEINELFEYVENAFEDIDDIESVQEGKADDPHGNEAHEREFVTWDDTKTKIVDNDELADSGVLVESLNIDGTATANRVETDTVAVGLPHGSPNDTWEIRRDSEGDLEITDSGVTVLHFNQSGDGTGPPDIQVNNGIEISQFDVSRNSDTDAQTRLQISSRVSGDILMELDLDGNLEVAGTVTENVDFS